MRVVLSAFFGLAAIGAAQTVSAPPKPIKIGSVTFTGSIRSRVESWDWFEPSSGDNAYTYSGNILRFGFSQSREGWDWNAEFAAPFLLGLPENPIAPGVQQLLIRTGVDTNGKHAVVLGRSNIVGRPMAALLLHDAPGGNATVTVCHSRTRGLDQYTRQADILIAAIGKPEFVTGTMIKPGAVVIDVGVNRVDDPSRKQGYRLVGDVKFGEAKQVASAITPVPGGVGPMTITMLLYNTVQAARQWVHH